MGFEMRDLNDRTVTLEVQVAQELLQTMGLRSFVPDRRPVQDRLFGQGDGPGQLERPGQPLPARR